MLTLGLILILLTLLLQAILPMRLGDRWQEVKATTVGVGVVMVSLLEVWPMIAIHNASHAQYRIVGLVIFLLIVVGGLVVTARHIGGFRSFTCKTARVLVLTDLIAAAMAVWLYAAI
jgi:hypothetical protein